MRKLLFTLLVFLSFCTYGFSQNNVIEPELQKAIEQKGDEMISINIIFKSQMDPMKLRTRVEKVTDKKVKRDIVVDELKSFSEREQQDVMSILKAEERGGKVTKITSHWLSNVITCTVTPDVIYHLSTHSDISIIGYNEEKYMLWGEEAMHVEASKDQMTQNITMVNADDVWELGFTGEGVVVAVVDTGVNYNHVDLADHLWDGGPEFPNHGYNTYSNNNNPMDGNGHGTHCSGTVCGDGTSGLSTGMAPNATLMCVKCLSDGGNGDANTISSGMEFAVEHYADVMSLSLGIPSSSVSERTMLRQTCVNALEAGVIAAIAVGNEGNQEWMYPIPNNVRVPGSCPPPWLHPEQEEANPGQLSCVVAIGAVNYNDVAANFTSHGPVTWTNTEYNDYPYQPEIGLIRPDVCAPGVGVISADFSNINGHVSMDGTSMATPCAAGVMCLALSKNPDLTPAEISMLFETTAVKLSENKSNITGSGRIDALAIVENITAGYLEAGEYSFTEVDGNYNGNLNPGEEFNITLEVINTSEETISNVSLVMTCNNENVTITDSEASIGSIPALGTITLDEEFSFVIGESAEVNEAINFEISTFDSNDEKISSFRLKTEVYGNKIEFSSIVVEDDDNGNGILEAGETANLAVILENIGNEIAVSIDGILSSEEDYITINEDEAYFNSIGGKSSSIAYFNVTASDNLPTSYSIPMELTCTDAYGNINEFDITFANNCDVIFNLVDSFGDGWNNAVLHVNYSDGSPADEFTIQGGASATYTKNITSGVEVSLSWTSGYYDAECSFTITYGNGTVIYNGTGNQGSGTFFSWINNCSGGGSHTEMGDPIQNLEVSTNMLSVEFSWDEPAEGDAISYEIYRETKLVGTTEELTYTDEVESEGIYNYSVRPVYNDIYGLFVCTEVDVTTCPSISDLIVDVEDLDMTLTWTEPNDMTDFVEYKVYLNDELVGNTTEPIFEKEITVGDYTATVEAVYTYCQGHKTIEFSVCDPIESIEYHVDNRTINLSWTVDESINIEKYEIYVNGIYFVWTSHTELSTEMEHGIYDIEVRAITDDCFAIGKLVEDIIVCNLDEAVVLEAEMVEDYVIELNWNNLDFVSGYVVYRNDEIIAEVSENTYTDSSISENGNYCYIVAVKCDDNIGAISEEVCITFNVSLGEISDAEVTIYPNPSKDNFFVVCEGMTNIKVYNILGEKISEEEISSDKYEINGLVSGTYFVQIETSEGMIVKRVVKL